MVPGQECVDGTRSRVLTVPGQEVLIVPGQYRSEVLIVPGQEF